MEFPRASGILLHPTSLPSPYGIGDLGPEAYAFADFLLKAGQTLWQMLPLGPTGVGYSPYACFSAFAGNTLLISPEQLVDDGLLTGEDLASLTSLAGDQVDFEMARTAKDECLKKAFRRYQSFAETSLRKQLESFIAINDYWLDDYALFRALKMRNDGAPWNEWDSLLAKREPAALARAREDLREQVEEEKFFQFLFFKQWFALKTCCNERGISLIGDIPIFVAHDSAEVWINAEQFKLNDDGLPLVVAGVPPDYFSATGQFWGNPIYDWGRMSADGFKWWIRRIRAALRMFDMVRIDHFRGFAACWEIPAGERTAENGTWVEAPGRDLFTRANEALGELPIIAEDLGVITPDVEQLRDEFGFSGMRVLQFAFSSDTKNIHLPHNYSSNLVAYTGTHDNDTATGWFNSAVTEGAGRTAKEIQAERDFCLEYLNTDGAELHWDFIRAVWASVANIAIVPLQDLLGLGSEARMNVPNSNAGNWKWRFKQGALTNEVARTLRDLTESFSRCTGADARLSL
jgi:4-alpha-glucanotransferase